MSVPESTSQPSAPPSLRRRFGSWCSRRRWWIEVVAVILVGAGVSRYLEGKDFWLQARYWTYSKIEKGVPFHGGHAAPEPKTTVLLIGDDAYWDGEPAGRAPISRRYLANLVKGLTDQSSHLKVIALDFDLRSEHSGPAIDRKKKAENHEHYGEETRDLVQAIRYALSHGVNVVLPKSIWRDEGGAYFEERDVYEDEAVTASGPACSFIQGELCAPLQPDEEARSVPGKTSGRLYFGYIALPHKTWRLPFQLNVTNRQNREYLLNPFSWAVAYAAGAQTMTWPDRDTSAKFARYLDPAQWRRGHAVTAAEKTDATVAAVAAKDPQVLLIGGDWQTRAYQRGDFADRYSTPAGDIPGVFIHANYVEDFWILNTAPSPVNERLLFVLDCIFAFALAGVLKLTDRMPQESVWKRFQMTVVRIIVVAIAIFIVSAVGYFVMMKWRVFFDLTIVVIGVVAHYAWDSVDWFWRERHRESPAANGPTGVMEMPRPAMPNTSPGKEHASRKKKRSASARMIVGGLLLCLTLGNGRLHAASPQTNSGAKTDQQQPYKDNDIDVNKPGGARGPKIPWVIVKMVNTKGANIGRATVTSLKSGGVEVKLDLSDLPPGEHALHFHQNAKCDPPDFKSAGLHFNPEKKEHGLKNPKGPHAGDMENFSVGADGITTATVKDPNVTLGDKNSLLANGGTALVIHAKADDMKTDPAGNAGERIACGVVSH